MAFFFYNNKSILLSQERGFEWFTYYRKRFIFISPRGGILTYKDSKERGWRQLEAIIITYKEFCMSLSLSLYLCVHTHIALIQLFSFPPFSLDIKSDMKYFSHMTPDRIHPSTFGRLDFFVPLLFFDTLPLYTNVYTVTAESIEIDSEISFLFSTNRLDTPLKIDTSIYYTKVFLWLYIHARRLWRRFFENIASKIIIIK